MSAGQTPAEEVTTRVLDYWVGKPRSRYAGASPDRKKLWFSSSKEADEFIIQSFGEDVENALNGDRGDLSKVGIRGELALVILLDQFTRNCFRSTAKAFAGDEDALDIARKYYDGVSNRQAAKQKLSLYERFFLYMPLMHSEDLSISKKSVQAVQMLADECQAAVEKGDEDAAEGHAAMLQSLSFAQTHVDILQKFGRFPHRNEALNRESTDDEIAYLKDGPRFGQ